MSEPLKFWLKTLLGQEVIFSDVRKDPNNTLNLVIYILNKFDLIDPHHVKAINSSITFEDKFRVISEPLKHLNIKVNDHYIALIKHGNLEKIERLFEKIYKQLAPALNFQYRQIREVHDRFSCGDSRFSRFKVDKVADLQKPCTSVDLKYVNAETRLEKLKDFTKNRQDAMKNDLKRRYRSKNRPKSASSISSLTLVKPRPVTITTRCPKNCLKKHFSDKLHCDTLEFDTRFMAPNPSYDELLHLQQMGQCMQPEGWNPCKYYIAKDFITQRRATREMVLRETKNKILNQVFDSMEREHYEGTIERENKILARKTSLEKRLAGNAVEKLLELEDENLKQAEIKCKEKLFEEQRIKIMKAKDRVKLRARKAVQDRYIAVLRAYQSKKAYEKQLDESMLDSIFKTSIDLALVASNYSIHHSQILPYIIWIDYKTLSTKNLPWYLLPSYDPLDELEEPKVIEVDLVQAMVLKQAYFEEYYNGRGEWKSTHGLPGSTELEKILKALQCTQTCDNQLKIDPNIGQLRVRAIIHTNSDDEKNLTEIYCTLKAELKKVHIEVIELDTLIRNLIYESYEEMNAAEDDDGVCELIPDDGSLYNARSTISLISPVIRKSSLKRSNEARKSASRIKSNRSVLISDVLLQTERSSPPALSNMLLEVEKVTRTTQTPTTWQKNNINSLLDLLKIISPIINAGVSTYSLSPVLKIKIIMTYLETLPSIAGFVLLDFPKTLEEHQLIQQLLTGQDPELISRKFYELRDQGCDKLTANSKRSFFTHFVRLKNIDEAHEGLYIDEVDHEEFFKIQKFYQELAFYETVKHKGVNDETVESILATLQTSSPNTSQFSLVNPIENPTRSFFRFPRSLTKAEVELQVDFNDTDYESGEIEQRQLEARVDQWTNELSKLFAEEQLGKFKSVEAVHAVECMNVLETRGSVLRQNVAFRHFLEAAKERALTRKLPEQDLLEMFVENYRDTALVKPWNDEIQTQLLKLILELENNLKTLINIKYHNASDTLNRLTMDPSNLGHFLIQHIQWLLFYELKKSTSIIKTIIDLFEFLLHEPIPVDLPLPPSPLPEVPSSTESCQSEASEGTCKLKSTTSSLRLDTLTKLSSDSQAKSSDLYDEGSMKKDSGSTIREDANPDGLKNDLEQRLQDYVDSCAQYMHHVLMEVNEKLAIDVEPSETQSLSVTSEYSKPSHLSKKSSDTLSAVSTKSKRSVKSKQSKISKASKSLSVASIQQPNSQSLKLQLKKIIEEQVSITANVHQKILRRSQKDLDSIFVDTFKFLKKFRNEIDDLQNQDLDALACLKQDLHSAINDKMVHLQIQRCDKFYQVFARPDFGTLPALSHLDSLSELSHLLDAINVLVLKLTIAFKNYRGSSSIVLDVVLKFFRDWEQTKGCWLNCFKEIQGALLLSKGVTTDDFSIDWRDVILSILGIKFPTFEELLDLKTSFEQARASEFLDFISKRKFVKIPLWFEKNYPEGISQQLKEILFKMYQRTETSICYEKLLCALCRDHNRPTGFLKALKLLTEDEFNIDNQLGQVFVQLLRVKKACEEKIFKAEKSSMVELLKKIIEDLELKDLPTPQPSSSKSKLKRRSSRLTTSSPEGSVVDTLEGSKVSSKKFSDTASVVSTKSRRSVRSKQSRRSKKISDDLETLAEVDDEPGELPKIVTKKKRKSSRNSLAQITEEGDNASVIFTIQPTDPCTTYPCSKLLPILEDGPVPKVSVSNSTLKRSKLQLSQENPELDQDTLTKVLEQLSSPQFNDRNFYIELTHIRKLIEVMFQAEKESIHPIFLNDCLVCIKHWLMAGSKGEGEVDHANDDGKVAAHLFARDRLVQHWITQGLEFKILFQIEREESQ